MKRVLLASVVFCCTFAAVATAADVVNGDFSQGNVGFSNGYTYSSSNLWSEGYYTVGTNPHLYHSGGASFGDHTTGSSLMLIANGSPTVVPVWSETIDLAPNTVYQLSAYAAAWGDVNQMDPSPANLSFTVAGTQIGSTLTLPAPDGQWAHYLGTFSSGALSAATISITDLNTAAYGNDFAVDDISLVAVPEPSGLALVGATAAVCLPRRKRRASEAGRG